MALLAVQPAFAVSTGDFSSFFVFGDSLSDNGNAFALSHGTTPDPTLYPTHRYSNGPVWDEPLMAAFLAKGDASANFAIGGATAGSGSGSTDLASQIAAFAGSGATALLGSAPLASVWAGANDLFAAIGSASLSKAEVTVAAQQAANSVAAGITSLASLGVNNFLVPNLPDLGRVPIYATYMPGLADRASQASADFNAALSSRLASLRATGLDVRSLDINSLFGKLVSTNGSAFGVSNVKTPCVTPSGEVCTSAELAQDAFYDPAHPTETIHQAIADAASATIAAVPVPLPAISLGTGLLAFLVLRRRRDARKLA